MAAAGRATTAAAAAGTPRTPPGPPVDSYGCGDSFVAGVTVGLGRGLDLDGGARPRAPAAAPSASPAAGALGPQLVERA